MNYLPAGRKRPRIAVQAVLWLIVLVMLVSCGGNTANTTTAAPTTAATTAATTTQAPTTTTEAAPPGVNHAGEPWWDIWLEQKPAPGTFDARIGPMAGSTPFKLRVVHLFGQNSAVEDGITPENSMWNEIVKDQLNIEFEYLWVIPSEQYDQRFQLSVSSGDIPDVLRMNQKQFRQFVDTKSLRDVSEAYNKFAIPEFHAMDAKFDYAPIKQATVDGKMLAYPRYEDNHASVNIVWYRKDWADALGIEEPKDIFEMIDMAIAFSKQPDHPERVGLIAQKNPFDDNYSFGSIFQAFGAYPEKWILKDGKPVPGIIQDEMLAGLKAAKDLYDAGAVNKDFSTFGWDQAIERITNSTIGIAYGKWWSPDAPLAANLQYDPTAEWKQMPIPGLTAGVPAKSSIQENMVHFYMGVYKNAPEGAEEAMMRVLNFYFVRTFPASNDIWPQAPLPDEETRLRNIENSKIVQKKGLIWDWCPILCWNATENSDRARICNEALKTGDTSHFRNAGDKSWYDDAKLWVEKGVNDSNFHMNWRQYASRVMDDNGVLLTCRMRDEGHTVYNVFYGGATETEEQVSSQLKDLYIEFGTKFIMGEVGEKDWPDFKQEWLSLGGQDWWDEVVAGYNLIH